MFVCRSISSSDDCWMVVSLLVFSASSVSSILSYGSGDVFVSWWSLFVVGMCSRTSASVSIGCDNWFC